MTAVARASGSPAKMIGSRTATSKSWTAALEKADFTIASTSLRVATPTAGRLSITSGTAVNPRSRT